VGFSDNGDLVSYISYADPTAVATVPSVPYTTAAVAVGKQSNGTTYRVCLHRNVFRYSARTPLLLDIPVFQLVTSEYKGL